MTDITSSLLDLVPNLPKVSTTPEYSQFDKSSHSLVKPT